MPVRTTGTISSWDKETGVIAKSKNKKNFMIKKPAHTIIQWQIDSSKEPVNSLLTFFCLLPFSNQHSFLFSLFS
jgi:hypothetical protein